MLISNLSICLAVLIHNIFKKVWVKSFEFHQAAIIIFVIHYKIIILHNLFVIQLHMKGNPGFLSYQKLRRQMSSGIISELC